MSMFERNRWTDWAREWGFQHVPQHGFGTRTEKLMGLRNGRLVLVRWAPNANGVLVVQVRFPKVTDVGSLRGRLIADPALNAMPGKGAGRKRMWIETGKPGLLRGSSEYALTATALTWRHPCVWSTPGTAKLRAWVETLLGAVERATAAFDGGCENCATGRVDHYVLVNDVPAMLCASCQQKLRAEGEMAERTYEMLEARHAAGAALAALAALVGGVVWGGLEALTGRIFAAVAIVVGVFVAWAYRKGAGRVDAMGRVIGGAFTLAAVALGDTLMIAYQVWHDHPDFGFRPDRALFGYLYVWVKRPTALLPSLFFALIGAWIAWKALQRPRLAADIRQADGTAGEAQKRAA